MTDGGRPRFRLEQLNFTVSRRLLMTCATLLVAYVATGRLGLMLAVPPGYATAVFLPAGIAVGAMLTFGAATLPWTFAASFLLNLWVGYGVAHHLDSTTVLAAVAIAVASALQAALGGGVLRRAIGYPAPLDNPRDLSRFLLSPPVFCLVSATLSVAALWRLGVLPTSDLVSSWTTWWIGDTLGVLVVLPVILVLIGEPRALWRSRARSVVVPMALFFGLFVAIFVRVSAWENQDALLEYRLDSQHLADGISSSLKEQSVFLEQLAEVFASHLVLTRPDFSEMVQKLLQRFSFIQAVEWAPRVTLAKRAAFEVAEQIDFSGFAIREADPSGRLRTAGEHAQYYPVTYVEPLDGNEEAVGFDLGSNAARRAAIETAITQERVTATAPIRLVQEHGNQESILLIGAVPNGPNGPGIVLIVLQMETVIRKFLGPLDQMVGVRLVDLAGTVPLFDDSPTSAATAYAAAIDFGTRRYRLQTAPLPAYLASHRGWQSWVVLVAGVLSTGLLGALLLLATGQSYRFQRLVDERTRDLRSTNQRLKVEMKERWQAEAALHQARRMEAIGQLTGGVAHDFNNLLMIIGGNIERLRSKLPSGGDTLRFLDMIESAVGRGENLTRRLLAFAQRRKLQPSVVDVARLTGDAAEMLRRSLRGDIEIRSDLPPTACLAKVDASELELAILNLAVNAQDAMSHSGVVALSVRPVTLNGEGSVDGLVGEYVAIGLSDTGTGISADLLPRVFEPFFTTKEVGKGTGLGLSQVYGFARQSGGTATISSTLDHGTTVTLYLPQAKDAPQPATSPPQAEIFAVVRGNALVVEDDSAVAVICADALEQLGYRTDRVESAHAALKFMQRGAPVDLVVSDILMPGSVNGLELARQIRRQWPRVAILLMTGYSGDDQDPAGEGFALLRKPFDLTTLADALQKVLRR
jgi:signal transduction histidine kinase/CheY-like chemotaxis protein/integral membrane sensor domain MASE1